MLHDEYRPKDYSEFCGNPKAVKVLQRITQKDNFINGCFWIDGASGTGKTTLAEITASKLAHEHNITRLDGHKCDVNAVRKLERDMVFRPMGGKFRVIIVNEAHAMTTQAVNGWLTLLDGLPRHTVVFFTTTEGRDKVMFGNLDAPLKSRCVAISLTNQGLADVFAQRAQEIAKAEGLDGATPAKFKRLVQDNKNNMRAVINAIEAGDMVA